MTARKTAPLLSLAILLPISGACIAAYLTIVHYADQPVACSSIGDCELVNSSRYASIGGVPVALMGVLAYMTIAATAAASWLRRDATLLAAAWVVALASFAISMYLTYIELRVLDAICIYCVASASIVTALVIVLSAAVWNQRTELFESRPDPEAGDREIVA